MLTKENWSSFGSAALYGLVSGVYESLRTEVIGRDACVLGSRVLVECLRRLDIECREVPSILIVDNPELVRTKDPNSRGAARLLLSIPDADGKPLAAHLVVVVYDGGEWKLVDVTFSQIERPEHGIPDMGPAIVDGPGSGAMGRVKRGESGSGDLMIESEAEGCAVRWLLLPNQPFHLNTPDWNCLAGLLEALTQRSLARGYEFASDTAFLREMSGDGQVPRT